MTDQEGTEPPSAAPDPRQPELDLGVVLTGDNRVDEALAELDQLAGRPVDEHAAVYEKVHRGLQAALVGEPGHPGG